MSNHVICFDFLVDPVGPEDHEGPVFPVDREIHSNRWSQLCRSVLEGRLCPVYHQALEGQMALYSCSCQSSEIDVAVIWGESIGMRYCTGG